VDGQKKIKVFVTVVSKKIIDNYINILNQLKLKPIAVDIPSNSVSKFFKLDIETGAACGKKCGLDLPLSSIYLGSSDAAAFSQAGLKASALAAMDPSPARYYHTRLDDKENLSEECIEKAIEVLLEAVKIFDEKGLQI